MKLIIAFIAALIFNIQSVNLDSIRAKYPTAHQTKASAEAFGKLVGNSGSGATMEGYRAAAKIIQAKFAVGEGRKKMITAGATSLESVIKSAPQNVELRLIRMSVQESLPKFIKYDRHLAADKQFIISKFGSQDTALKSYIKKFASRSKSFSAADRASLK